MGGAAGAVGRRRPAPGPGNVNEKGQKRPRSIWGVNLPGLVDRDLPQGPVVWSSPEASSARRLPSWNLMSELHMSPVALAVLKGSHKSPFKVHPQREETM